MTKEVDAMKKHANDGDSVLARSKKEYLAIRERLGRRRKSGVAEKIDADLKKKTRMTPEKLERQMTI